MKGSAIHFNDLSSSRLITSDIENQYLELAFGTYRKAYSRSSSAQEYLIAERGISEVQLRHYGIGFCDRSLGKALPDADHFEGAMIRGALQRYGVIKPNGREFFRGCIVIPVRDENGKIVDAYGRKIIRYQRKGIGHHFRLNAFSTSFFNSEVILHSNRVVMCSSPIEALSLLTRGIKRVISLLGVDTFNEYLAKELARNGIEEVICVFPNTIFGRRTVVAIESSLTEYGIQTAIIELPKGEDINSMHVKSRFSDYVDELFSSLKTETIN